MSSSPHYVDTDNIECYDASDNKDSVESVADNTNHVYIITSSAPRAFKFKTDSSYISDLDEDSPSMTASKTDDNDIGGSSDREIGNSMLKVQLCSNVKSDHVGHSTVDDDGYRSDDVKIEITPVNSDSDHTSGSPVSTPSTTLEYSNSLEALHDSKEGIEELCPVCGDKVSGYHYGLLTCESCKGFFKRTVQNKKVYTCVAERTCQIDKTQRKRCPYCRFQKCLDVGMKLEAVRADRMRGGRNKFGPMYKRDRARKMQIIRNRQYSNTGMISTSRGVPTSSVGITYSTSYSTPSPIKEEIQSPFLSSSTSSPDSSPAPMQGITSAHLPQSITSGTTIAVTATGANATVAGNAEFSLWVGGTPAAQNTPSSSNSGSGLRRTAINTTANSTAAQLSTNSRVPSLVRHLLQMVDDAEWQTSLYNLIQNQTYNQCNVDLFELLCKVLDQNLFSQVDWARNSFFFKELRVDDQMKLLQYSWSDLLILDHLHQRIHNKLQDEITLPDGQTFDLLSLALLGTTQFSEQFQRVLNQMIEIQFDVGDYICMKFVILLNPGEEDDPRNLSDRRSVVQAHDQIRAAFQEYCRVLHPEEQDRYDRLMQIGAELHFIADNGERYLYMKHVNGAAPGQTLLMELLHNRRR